MRDVAFLTPTEAARLLGLSLSGVRWLADTGRLRAERTLTGRRIIRARDAERLRQDREAQGVPYSPARRALRDGRAGR